MFVIEDNDDIEGMTSRCKVGMFSKRLTELFLNVNFKLKQIKHNKPPASGQRSLWLAYENTPLFLLSVSGIPKIVNIKHIKKLIKKMAHVNIKHGKKIKKN